MTLVKAIVKFKSEEIKANISSVEILGANIVDKVESINSVILQIDTSKLGKLKLNSNIEYIEVLNSDDHDVHIMGFKGSKLVIRPDQLFKMSSLQWGLSKINTQGVWNLGFKGKNIRVCIIDTGIDYTHPNLKDAYITGWNFINSTNNPMDDNGHGTHVSGIVGARPISGNDISGVAPEVDLYGVKVLDSNGSGSYANIILGIQWAINNNMQIINMSFGGTTYSQALSDICKVAYDKGIILVAAAGNSDGNGTSNTLIYPAKLDTVIAVGATDVSDNRASFSSCGIELEVSAPGVNIVSTVPSGKCQLCDPSGYSSLNGTSMATPFVVGTCALVLQSDAQPSNEGTRNIINNTSIDLGYTGRDIFFGHGRIDSFRAFTNNPNPPSSKKYSCSGAPNYICIEDINGKYNTIQECQLACTKPIMKYSCSGAPNYICIEDINGKYNTIQECQLACTKPIMKYSCSGAPNYICIEDINGKYNTIQECQLSCKKPNPSVRYSCKITTNGIKYCGYDPNGEFANFHDCQLNCKKITKKYDYVHITDSTGKVIGLTISLNENGIYTSDTMCQIICSELKSMDLQT